MRQIEHDARRCLDRFTEPIALGIVMGFGAGVSTGLLVAAVSLIVHLDPVGALVAVVALPLIFTFFGATMGFIVWATGELLQ